MKKIKKKHIFGNEKPKEGRGVNLISCDKTKDWGYIYCMLKDGMWYGLCGFLHYKTWETKDTDVWEYFD